jgi:hypothetical protein
MTKNTASGYAARGKNYTSIMKFTLGVIVSYFLLCPLHCIKTMFAPGKPFQPSLTFTYSAALHGLSSAFLPNVQLGYKRISETNATAYFRRQQ